MEIRYNIELVNEQLLAQQVFEAKINGVSGCKVDGKIVIFYTTRDLKTSEKQRLDELINSHNPNDFTYPLVMDLVDDQFNSLPIKKINFRDHLRPEIILSKSLTKAPNGRPDRAIYTYNNVNIALITWKFHDAPGGLYYLKEKMLSYYNSKGEEGERFLIKRNEIDFTIPNELAESIKERIDARDAIVDEIKAVCLGAIQGAMQIKLEQVVKLTQPFWNQFEVERSNFIELASHDWMNSIVAINELVEHEWMNTPVDSNGTTCKQYMLYRLGY